MVEPKLSHFKLLEDQGYTYGAHQKLSSVRSFSVSVKDLERVYKFKYLDAILLILDPFLTWNEHIEHIGNKISSNLRMIRRAQKVIPKEACITLFNAIMVLPLFDYCCCVRDGCGQGNKIYLSRPTSQASCGNNCGGWQTYRC